MSNTDLMRRFEKARKRCEARRARAREEGEQPIDSLGTVMAWVSLEEVEEGKQE